MDEVREMFLEYARELGFSLCFQGFDEELKTLPGSYFALIVEPGAGCVGVRPHDAATAEMKRLSLRPHPRGTRLGRRLAEKAIAAARERGYRRIVLDTIEGKMDAAIALYRKLGFREIPPYYENPIPGALYLELPLS
ncbi:MAG: GNAT family N-acetyltransferase [Myxococcales bacterium]